jgi:hypothetical protein
MVHPILWLLLTPFFSDSVASDNLSEAAVETESSADNISLEDTRSLQSRNTLNKIDLKHHSIWSDNVEIRDKTYFVEYLSGSESGGGPGGSKERMQILKRFLENLEIFG